MTRFTKDEWAAYVPSDRRRALAAGQEIPREAEGSLLKADPGFNELLEEYSHGNSSTASAEKMTRRLNAFFGVLTDAVARYGGSILSFSGGAALCWFQGDDGTRALDCALDLFDVLRQTADRRERVIVAQGRLERFLAGDPEIQSFDVVSGEVLERIERIEKLLRPGEFGLDQRLSAVATDLRVPISLGRTGQGDPMALLGAAARPRGDAVEEALPPVDVDEDAARAFVPPDVWERLVSGDGELAPDVRPALVFCLRFWLPEEKRTLEELQTHVKSIQATVHRYRGCLVHVDAGRGDVTLWAAFGAPVSHDDETLAALAALAEVRQRTQGWTEFRAGVCQGPVYSGTYGGTQRKTFGIVGIEVSLSALIQESAPAGAIAVSAAVRRNAGDHYHFTSTEPLAWGDAAPLPLFLLGEARERKELLRLQSQGRTPILGREKDLAPFLDWFAILPQGTGGAALIEGDPGIGKSRLLTELGLQAQLKGITVLEGAGDSIQTTSPFLSWRSLVLDLLGLESNQNLGADDLLPFLKGGDQERLLPLLGTVLAVPVEDNEFTASLSGENRVNLTADLVVSLIRDRALAQGSPLVIFLEDLQWMDQPSWSVTATVLKDLPQVLVLFTSRVVAPGTSAALDALVTRPNLLRMKLEGLVPKAALEVARVRLGAETLPEAVERFLTTRAEGNPFYTLELAFALRDAGFLAIQDRVGALTAKFPGWDALPFPQNLEGVVATRLDRLPQGAQNLIKLACVVGRRFPYSLLEGLYLQAGQGTTDLVANLGLLAAWELVVRDPESAVPTYQFHHSVIQDVTYKHLLGSQKQDLHRRVAQWYETRYAENLVPYSPVLAYHWREAGALDKALGYFVQAGMEALRQYANLGALAHLEKALELDSGLAERLLTDRVRGEVELAIGEAYLQSSSYNQAVRHFETGLALLGRPIPRSGLKMGFGILVGVFRQIINRRNGPKLFVGTEDERSVLELVCRTMITLVESYGVNGRLDKAIYSTMVGVNLAEWLDLKVEQARSYSYCAVTLSFLGLQKNADDYVDLSESSLQSSFINKDRILTQLALGFFHSGRGSFTRAQNAFLRLAEDAMATGDHRRTRDSFNFQTATSIFQGYFGEAYETSQILQALSRDYNDADMLCVASAWRLLAAVELSHDNLNADHGQLAEMVKNSTVELYRQFGNSVSAYSHALQGRIDEALELTDSVVEFFETRQFLLFSEYYLAALPPEIYLLACQDGSQKSSRLESRLRRSVASLKRYAKGFPIGLPSYCRIRGQLELRRGRTGTALTWFRNGLRKAEELSMNLERGRLLLAIGAMKNVDRDERIFTLVESSKCFQELGLARYLRVNESLLSGLE